MNYHVRQQRHLLIFLKYPTPGEVKTRLGRVLGPDTAAWLYRRMAETIAKRLTSLPRHHFNTTIFYHPPDKASEFKAWLGPNLLYTPQKGNDLGERIYNAFLTTDPGQTVIIGGDCPEITPEIILQAFQALKKYNIVIGPATDGGYYLIGLSHPRAELFRGIDWGTEKVFHQTTQKVQALQLSCHILPAMRDVDAPEDLHVLLPYLPSEQIYRLCRGK